MRIKEIVDNAMKNSNLLNGGVSAFADGTLYSAFCTVGDGYTKNGKLYTFSNMYEINFYNCCNGCTIYKSNNISLHYKCFTCGETVEPFGKNFFAKGCRTFENLEIDEILTKLVNRNFTTYKTITQNKDNYDFLKAMQKRLIKVLLYHDLIYYSNNLKKYVDIKYKEYGM